MPGACATPARRLALAMHQRCYGGLISRDPRGKPGKKPSAMCQETREDPGMPHAVHCVETSASQEQEARKNSGFTVSLAPSCTPEHSRMLLLAAHVRPAQRPCLGLHRQGVCAEARQKAVGDGESDTWHTRETVAMVDTSSKRVMGTGRAVDRSRRGHARCLALDGSTPRPPPPGCTVANTHLGHRLFHGYVL
jgi:hypothetical protein